MKNIKKYDEFIFENTDNEEIILLDYGVCNKPKKITVKGEKYELLPSYNSILNNDHYFKLIEYNGEIVGEIDYTFKDDIIEIISIRVDSSLRDKGIGKKSVFMIIKDYDKAIMMVTNMSRKFWVEKCGAIRMTKDMFEKINDKKSYSTDYYYINVK